MARSRSLAFPANAKRHRILLDVTFKRSAPYAEAVELFLMCIADSVGDEIKIVRPMHTEKVFKVTKRALDGEIKAELEMAMDAIREARNKLS